jgi:hypothetical protein
MPDYEGQYVPAIAWMAAETWRPPGNNGKRRMRRRFSSSVFHAASRLLIRRRRQALLTRREVDVFQPKLDCVWFGLATVDDHRVFRDVEFSHIIYFQDCPAREMNIDCPRLTGAGLAKGLATEVVERSAILLSHLSLPPVSAMNGSLPDVLSLQGPEPGK